MAPRGRPAHARISGRAFALFAPPALCQNPAAARAALLIEQELSGEDDPAVDAWLERVEQPGAFAKEDWFALSAADRERFRRFRHALPELVNETVRRSGALKMNSDYAVPRARNREMLAYYRRRLEIEFPGRHVISGHIGDAHVHVNLFSDPADPNRASDLLSSSPATPFNWADRLR